MAEVFLLLLNFQNMKLSQFFSNVFADESYLKINNLNCFEVIGGRY